MIVCEYRSFVNSSNTIIDHSPASVSAFPGTDHNYFIHLNNRPLLAFHRCVRLEWSWFRGVIWLAGELGGGLWLLDFYTVSLLSTG